MGWLQNKFEKNFLDTSVSQKIMAWLRAQEIEFKLNNRNVPLLT